MAKKLKETPVVENGLKEVAVETVEVQQPVQDVVLNETTSEVQTIGHSTRAFRG